ncbi:hypothetical protein HMPREF2604_04025 [Corynebacterium sp. HMSC055A01]|uniref:DUF3068 domain-containing protein n=1 Tax=Corynebacterium sp. HMSC055A01 TaxID=1715083 RepID=UPI0008A452C8|nr:DUF3068 domain-containing protein [Corynebacterium sp. HMSC055A01]OFN20290.1 hypothetical protein HMPREF2604_04025 [Corynebacterium sp. HMSC055A01]
MFLRSRLAQVTIAAAVFLILGSILPPLYNNQSRPLPRDLNLEIHAEHDGATFTRHTTTAPAMKDSVARAQSTVDLTFNGETIAHITEESQLNRESTYPVAGPNTTQHIELPAFDVQVEDRVERDGISYFFPSGAEQRSYPFFDPLTQDTEPIDFLRDEKLDSIPTYVFHQDVAPVSLGEVFAFEAHRSGPAGDFYSAESLERYDLKPKSHVILEPFYAVSRTVWVEPTTGTIVNEEEHPRIFWATDARQAQAMVDADDTHERALLDVPLSWSDSTRTERLDSVRRVIDTVKILSLVGWLGKAIGVVLLAVAAAMFMRRHAAQSA